MHFRYKTEGVCSQYIDFDIENNIVTNVKFTGGCNGNLKAIGKLVEGQSADYIIEKLQGNTCGFRSTSCADQLAKALSEAKNHQ